jgi:hypothetical protein
MKPQTEALLEKIIAELGENITVTVAGRSWLVPRRYIAQWGLKAAEIETLGFEEITEPSDGPL